MDLHASAGGLPGIAPGDRVMASGAAIGMPEPADNLEGTAMIHVEQRREFLDALLIDNLDTRAQVLAHLRPPMEGA
jgi:hypothetical protein